MVPLLVVFNRPGSQILLVPLSEKRHRLYTNELPEVIRGLFLRLEKLTEERKEEEKAKIVYRALFRLMFVTSGGRPKYPEFTWDAVENFLHIYKNDT